jgi:predicted XRE-type DNA-binding protein
MSDKRFSSVWNVIEDTPEGAENMKVRSALMVALKEHIARAGLSQSRASKLFGVTQLRVSDLVRGKINLFGLDALVNMAVAAGLPAPHEYRFDDLVAGITKANLHDSVDFGVPGGREAR